MLDGSGKGSTKGSGWSAYDHARLFAWLHIAGQFYPDLAPRALAIQNRLRLASLVKDGVPAGGVAAGTSNIVLPENTLGYAQYIAAAFSLAGLALDSVFDYANTQVTLVDGIPVLSDVSPKANLTGDPFLAGIIEFGGLDGCFERAALALLDAQRAHAQRTGVAVALGDELLDREPWFVSGTVISGGVAWKVATAGGESRPELNTFSAKAAFGMWAVRPDVYGLALRARALQLAGARGFAAGFYDGGAINTATTLATNSAILEALWFVQRAGRPLFRIDSPPVSSCPLSGRAGES
jgi:hypothetical protein